MEGQDKALALTKQVINKYLSPLAIKDCKATVNTILVSLRKVIGETKKIQNEGAKSFKTALKNISGTNYANDVTYNIEKKLEDHLNEYPTVDLLALVEGLEKIPESKKTKTNSEMEEFLRKLSRKIIHWENLGET